MTLNYFKALMPLLAGLGWKGDQRAIFESLPHLTPTLDLDGFREIMGNLGYQSQTSATPIGKIPDHPGLFIQKNTIYIILKADEHHVYAKDMESGEELILSRKKRLRGTFCCFFSESIHVKVKRTWLKELALRFKKQLFQLLFIGVFNALFALTLPLFIRSVFDWAIPSQSTETLTYLVYGLVLALVFAHIIHTVQNKSLGYIGARLNMIIGVAVMGKILRLPYSLIEGAPVPDQVSRIKQFDSIRDVFTSPLAQLLMEGPFLIFFIIILGIVGGSLVLIPIILIFCFIILGIIIFPIVRAGTTLSSATHMDKLSFLLEIFSKINTVKYLGGESVFIKKFEEKATRRSKAAEYNEIITAYATNIAQIFIKVAGIITIIWGAIKVMDGEMTMGSLVAVVLLIWRALSPFQSAFMFLSQFDQAVSTMKDINQLMSMPSENYAPSYIPMRKVEGTVHVENVAFRYQGSATPSLQGVSMHANPGEIIAIMGGNGSGKSTLLKLLLGFYQPLGGTISLDGIDIKQIPVNHLRKTLSFVPQTIQFFHGTVEQNLMLSAPDATQAEVIRACKNAMVWEDIERLPQGLQTRLSDRSTSILNSGFQQKLSLARAYLRKSRVLLFDEPASNLDMDGDAWFKQTIDSWRGKKTMIMVTHRPSIVKMADKVLVLAHGQMRFFGPTEKVLELLEKEKGAA